ncbi:hypothetical protein HGRIS_001228 [Hohenbuehelia grisea]|uniref:DUF6532 domain-containing protein n=1 Tax=Hohenbuehelia grisea TaxID=104357 RepID=A0ABR3JQW2_9AGAR
MVSTAHFADLWDNMSGTKYAGEYQFDDSTATVMGCPARAPSVRTLIKAIKNKSSAKGAAASRKHAVAMTLEDLTKIMEWSEKQCPSEWFDAKPGIDQATFRRVYIETVIKYAARLTNPWENASAAHIKIYQAVWNTVFPAVPHTFNLNHTDDKVLSLITQRTYEWRTRLAGEAINAVLQLENSDAEFKDLEYRKAWVTWALKPKYWGFTFAVADSENPNDWEGSFESDIVAKTFAAHFKFINRAVTVKSLPHLTSVPPGGALALSLVAVERALELWSQDVLSPAPNGTQVTLPMFDSATWATKTAGWTQSFLKLSLESWGDIIETAQSFTSAACKPPVKDKVMLAEPLDARASFVPRPRRK